MNWYKKAQQLETIDRTDSSIDDYRAIAHDLFFRNKKVDINNPNYLWVYKNGIIETNPETMERSSHSFCPQWNDVDYGSTYTGRFSPSTKTITIIRPMGVFEFREIPSHLKNLLQQKFPEAQKLSIHASAQNWYKKIIYAQVWATEEDGSFDDSLKSFYELEYKYQALKNFPFTGMPQRYENILEKVKDSLEGSMERLKDALISTFRGWLDTHALTEPALWAEKRADPYGEGFMSSYDAENALEGIIGEYIRYKHGGGQFSPYNRPNTSNVFSEILDEALAMSDKFSSLQGVERVIQEMDRERLTEDLYNDEFENFGINERGEAFQSEEEAETYIEQRIGEVSVQDYVSNFGKDELLSLLEGQGQMETFLVELNQYIIFPLWYNYWGAMGIDTTRELAEEAYEGLTNANSFEEFRNALQVAIQTCHQNGSMLDYLEEYGGEYDYGSPEDIEGTMLELTEGKANAEWDKQLKEIGVKIPIAVRKHNRELAKV